MIKSLTINFETNEAAQEFAIKWGRATLTGNSQSAVKKDGSRDVTVYDVCESKKEWIDNYINPVEIDFTNDELLKELGL